MEKSTILTLAEITVMTCRLNSGQLAVNVDAFARDWFERNQENPLGWPMTGMSLGNWEDEFSLKMLWAISEIKMEKVDGIILTVAHTAFRKISLNDLKNMQNESPILIDIPVSYNAEEAKKAGLYYRTL